MDPNANLEEQARLLAAQDAGPLDYADRVRLRDLRLSLAGWIHGGGFDPVWEKFPGATEAFKQWHQQEYRRPGVPYAPR